MIDHCCNCVVLTGCHGTAHAARGIARPNPRTPAKALCLRRAVRGVARSQQTDSLRGASVKIVQNDTEKISMAPAQDDTHNSRMVSIFFAAVAPTPRAPARSPAGCKRDKYESREHIININTLIHALLERDVLLYRALETPIDHVGQVRIF